MKTRSTHTTTTPTTPTSPTPSAAPTNAKKAEIVVILDRSGSMESIASDAIGGFNAFVETQRKEPGTARLTLVMFDDQYEVPIKAKPLGQVPPLTDRTFVPRGSTALLDAIGRTLKKTTEAMASRHAAEKPDVIIVAILTDGLENASRHYTQAHIADLIAAKRAAGWEFIFLAANQDAIASAASLNIPRADADAFVADPAGAADGFQKMHRIMSAKRGK